MRVFPSKRLESVEVARWSIPGLGSWVLLVQHDDDRLPCWRDDYPEGAPECMEKWETGWPIRGATTRAEAVVNAALGLWGAPVVHMTDCDLFEDNSLDGLPANI